MTMERVDLMRRFITFIDVMYEHKVRSYRGTVQPLKPSIHPAVLA